MNIINCKDIRTQMLTEAKIELTKIFALTGKVLKLVVIQVGNDPASSTYIKNKIKTCDECGVECEHIKLPEDIKIGDLRKVVSAACEDNSVTGCMIQLPLPEHLKKYEHSLLDMIPWYKDVDGLCTDNVGRLWSDKPCITPATAQGVIRVLENVLELEDFEGKDICVVGRSNLVGKPLVKLLEQKNATVTLCHSKTIDVSIHTRFSDVVITAIGKPKYFNKDYFAKHKYFDNQVLIDVGINRDENGKLCGDIDIDLLKYYDVDITPVPGGVGLLTTAQLVLNVVKAYQLQNGGLHV